MFRFDLNQALQIVVILLASVTLHELAHAVVADRLGDPTPRQNGQLTLNPAAHMDQFGMLFMVLAALAGFLFAFGRTLINPSNLKFGPQRGGAVVAAAGPLTNLLVAIVLGIVLKILLVALPGGTCSVTGVIVDPSTVAASPRMYNVAGFLDLAIETNLFLFLFNLIPIPPLDGFSIVSGFLTSRQLYGLAPLIQYAPAIFLLFILISFQTNFLVDHVFSPVFHSTHYSTPQRSDILVTHGGAYQSILGLPTYFKC